MPTKVCTVKAMVFPAVMYGCESWTIKKAECQRINAFELWCWIRLLRVPLDCKEIKPVNSKENQTWIFIGRTDAKAEALMLWTWWEKPTQLENTLMLGKIEGKRRRGGQRMRWLGQHHWFNGHEFKQTLGDTEEEGSLAYCSPWGHKESDMISWLNNNNDKVSPQRNHIEDRTP